MNLKIIACLLWITAFALSGPKAEAQPNYFQAVTNLNPAGYWPMHEIEAPAQGDIETNYGTLGLLGTGYYPDWQGGTSLILRGVPGALAGDTDTAVYFEEPSSNAGGVTNALYVPHSSPLSTLVPPFSVECWFFGTNNNQGDIWSQTGFEGLNAGNSGGGGGSVCGMRLYWNAPHITVYGYHNSSTLNQICDATTYSAGNWYHIVVTVDASTNVSLIINGNTVSSKAASSMFVPDSWTPFEVGNGRGNSRAVKGIVDEVAIYTNVLQDISAHYSAGTSASPSPTYFQTVTNDNPVIYLRMDGSAYTAPAIATWPVLTNFGSVGANGVYTPGTMPGILPGPTTSSGFVFQGLPNVNVAQLGGVSSFADAGSAAAYNPTGAKPFSLIAMFRGNPCDNRVQTIVGHTDNSWRLTMNNNGKLQTQLGTNTTSTVNSVGVYNDGNWHQVAMVYQPASSPNVTGTNALFVDGALDNAVTTVTTNGILPGTNLDVMLGADPQYTNNPNGVGRQFSGQVCEVAVFTNALTIANIQALYSAAGVPAFFTKQPVSASVNQGTAFTNSVTASGTTPLSYQWYKNNVPIPSQTNTTLILNPVAATDASTNYYVVVTNIYNSATSAVVTLTVFSSPTILSQLPVPHTNLYTLFAGVNPTFSLASVSGAVPISYQWYTNNVAVTGATNTSFGLTNVQPGTVTTFCVATNFVGSTTSFVWTVSVVGDPSAPYPQSVLSLKPIGYWRLNEPDNGMGNNNANVIAHDYVEGNDGIYTNVGLGFAGYNAATDPTTTAAQFGFASFSDCDANGIAGIDFASPTNTSPAFSIEAWVNGFAQTTDAGVVNKGYSGVEQFNLDTGSDGGATSHAFRFFVRNAAGTVSAVNSSVQPGTVWHHLVGVCDEPHGEVTFYIDGVSVGSVSLPAGSGILSNTNTMIIGSRQSSATTNNNDQFVGYINDVAVYNYALSASQVLSNYLSAGVAPYISQQPPANVSVSEGGTLSLSATAVGTAPLSYQWQDSFNSPLVAGQTTANLSISNVPFSLNGDTLSLMVSNLYGTTNTTSVSLTVASGPPQIIASNLPSQITLVSGKSFTYSVQAIGTLPLSYQWYDGASPVSGATSSAYTLVTGASNSYSVSVVITNIHGPLTSAVANVSIIAPVNNSYATTLLAFDPVGYWPLQETNAPAPANMETNYGTLGPLGNAYYAVTNSTVVTFGQTGAIAGDSDTAAGFSGVNGTTPQSYAFVPRVSPEVTLRPPFTWEVWVKPANGTFGDIMAEGGSEGLNGGNWAGMRLSWGGNFQVYANDGTITGTFTSSFTSPNYPAAQWHYCVLTYDGTTASVYVDGSASAVISGTMTAAVDTWTPFSIGAGRLTGSPPAPSRGFNGLEDEVAVYTNLLTVTQINNHYAAGTNSGGNYKQTVQNDHPLLYYRMDNPAFTNPAPSLYPTAYNYGSAPPNGAYLPGVVPGGVSGPTMTAVGADLVAAPINGVISCVDAGYDSSFNPSGTQPFTAMTWFQTYPSDSRLQTIMSHGQNWSMNLDGTTGRIVWNLGSGGNLTSASVLNDGNWHFVAAVYDGTTSYLYADGGTLNNSVSAGTLTGDMADDVYLGGNAAFTAVGSNAQYFAGAMAQAALFTNALTSTQIQQIYNAANVAEPTISIAASGSQLVITYTGTLVSSSKANGSYSVVPGAHSPYMFTPTGAQMFFRARNP